MIASAFSRWSNHQACRWLYGASRAMGILAIGTSSVHAGVPDTIQAHGFMSQALIVSRHNDFFGPSSQDGGSLQYTEIGANVSMRPTNSLLISAQVLSRRAGDDNENYEPKLDYGLLDYQFNTDANRGTGIQLGRIKHPYGLYNQTRDVAFTRPGILLPQSIYFDRTRSPALSSDGIIFYDEELMNSGTFYFHAGVGQVQTDSNVKETVIPQGLSGTVQGKNSYIGQVKYEHDAGRIVLAFTAAQANIEAKTNKEGDSDFKFQPYIFSFQYNAEDWSLTSEYALRKQSMSDWESSPGYKTIGESWYIQYTRRFLENWQWLVRYDTQVNDRSDKNGNRYEQKTNNKGYSQFAHDWTGGLRWSVSSKFLISAEYHYIDGTGWLPKSSSNDDRYWDMLLFQTSWRF